MDRVSRLNLNALFRERIRAEDNVEHFSIEDQPFELLHVKVEDVSMSQNQLFLCANDRLVETKDLSKYITDLDRSVYDKNGFWYIGVLKGKYLDDNVDMNRLSFSIPDGGFIKDLINTMSMDRILEECTRRIQNHLSIYLAPISEEKRTSIQSFIFMLYVM